MHEHNRQVPSSSLGLETVAPFQLVVEKPMNECI